MRPLVFVVMPFGKRQDLNRTTEIDFDQIYDQAIRPAVQAADLDVIRADEEQRGGIVYAPMYERLLLAEIVIADLTTANANVFYELGVRHAARPRSTILMCRAASDLPFDVRVLRAVEYAVDSPDGSLSCESRKRLTHALHQRLISAKEDFETVDSPLFQLIPDYCVVTLPHEVTETFRDRARYIDGLRTKMHLSVRGSDARDACTQMSALESEIRRTGFAELWVDLLLAYRDLGAWNEMVRLYREMPSELQGNRVVMEQYALALNRVGTPDGRKEAVAILNTVLMRFGPNPETYGILGRIHKDIYQEESLVGDSILAESHLDLAIECYGKGFEVDPRDYYPGVNTATLLKVKGTADALAQMNRVLPVVVFAVARRGGIASRDYWDVAAVLECACLSGDWRTARGAATRLLSLDARPWQYETTRRNVGLIVAVDKKAGRSVSEIEQILTILQRGV